MGASSFVVSIEAASAAEAYRLICERERAEARYDRDDEDGEDDAYNGTISTTRGFVMVPTPGGPSARGQSALKAAINAKIDQILESDDNRYGIEKWGKAGCFEITEGAKKKFIFFGWAAE